ncbi:hypothetical protein VTK73DRAFT_4105 [Phialemonium thermophilum]|uniref:Uncharacterized protein n=1 Tax=Phialemonium thermophilum TaxID=223376 RepID=A0ABR3VBH8_9PEZI
MARAVPPPTSPVDYIRRGRMRPTKSAATACQAHVLLTTPSPQQPRRIDVRKSGTTPTHARLSSATGLEPEPAGDHVSAGPAAGPTSRMRARDRRGAVRRGVSLGSDAAVSVREPDAQLQHGHEELGGVVPGLPRSAGRRGDSGIAAAACRRALRRDLDLHRLPRLAVAHGCCGVSLSGRGHTPGEPSRRGDRCGEGRSHGLGRPVGGGGGRVLLRWGQKRVVPLLPFQVTDVYMQDGRVLFWRRANQAALRRMESRQPRPRRAGSSQTVTGRQMTCLSSRCSRDMAWPLEAGPASRARAVACQPGCRRIAVALGTVDGESEAEKRSWFERHDAGDTCGCVGEHGDDMRGVAVA